MDEVFKALADPSRRQLLDQLHAASGQTLGELCAQLDMTRQSVTKHLAQLEAANLVATTWRGREKLHYLDPRPIHELSARWIGKFVRAQPQATGEAGLPSAQLGSAQMIHEASSETSRMAADAAICDREARKRPSSGR